MINSVGYNAVSFYLQKEVSSGSAEASQSTPVDGVDSASASEGIANSDGILTVDPVDIEKAEQLEIKNTKDLEKLNKELTKEVEELEKAEKLENAERGIIVVIIVTLFLRFLLLCA